MLIQNSQKESFWIINETCICSLLIRISKQKSGCLLLIRISKQNFGCLLLIRIHVDLHAIYLKEFKPGIHVDLFKQSSYQWGLNNSMQINVYFNNNNCKSNSSFQHEEISIYYKNNTLTAFYYSPEKEHTDTNIFLSL